MALLYDWISEIIIFLLIATIIDLLIPKNSYKKYIKLVVGLVLLLIFLKPLFYFVNLNLEQEIRRIVSIFEQENIEVENNFYKRDIEAGQDAYIYEHMEKELKSIAQYTLIDEYQVEIEFIEFLFEKDLISYEALTELIVYVTEYQGEGRIIKPIKDISINGEIKSRDQDGLKESIGQLLKELWELDKEKITIIWVGS